MGSSRAETKQGRAEEIFQRVSAGEEQLDATGIAEDDRADFEQLQADGEDLGPSQQGPLQSDTADGFQEDIGEA